MVPPTSYPHPKGSVILARGPEIARKPGFDVRWGGGRTSVETKVRATNFWSGSNRQTEEFCLPESAENVIIFRHLFGQKFAKNATEIFGAKRGKEKIDLLGVLVPPGLSGPLGRCGDVVQNPPSPWCRRVRGLLKGIHVPWRQRLLQGKPFFGHGRAADWF